MKATYFWFLCVFFSLSSTVVQAQEQDPYIPIDIPAQNLLKFNRFLLNPTFSTVREDKSYLNLYHRNQNIQFDNTFNTYLLSYSGRIGDRSGVGLSLYSQKAGTITNYGVMANYAYGLKLNDKSNFTFGFNMSYYNSGYDPNSSNVNTAEDPRLADLEGNSLLSFQPGFNLSYGAFDFGVYAENLFDYNIKSGQSLTEFGEKTFTAHLQYTKTFEEASGLLEGGRMLALARGTKPGENDTRLSGSLVLDLPKIGWMQGGYNTYYGVSGGIGFNLNKRVSLGYSVEKGTSEETKNLGLTHEINFAYSFQPTLTEDRVMLEQDSKDEVADAQEEFKKLDEEIAAEVAAKDEEIKKLRAQLEENDKVVAEVVFRQDSIERAREADLERRFAQVMQLANRGKGSNQNLEQEAKKIFFKPNNQKTAEEIRKNNLVSNTSTSASNSKNNDATTIASNTHNAKDAIASTNQNNKTSTKKDTYKNPNTEVKRDVIAAVNEPKQNNSFKTTVKKDKISTPKSADVVAFEKAAKKNKVRSKRLTNISGVDSGYYIVANVYKGNYYFNKFMKDMADQGHDVQYFKNPKNGMKYVYLKKFDNWEEAMSSYQSKVDGTYQDDIWIMNVDNRTVQNANFSSNNALVNGSSSKNSQYNDNVLQKNVVKSTKLSTFDKAKKQTAVSANRTFTKQSAVKRKPIKKAKVVAVKGLEQGYYLVANVFSVKRNADNFVKDLKNQGLEADYFVNPNNNYRYVYLRKHSSWNDALTSYYSNLNDTYDQDIWIMRVAPNLLL